MRGSRARARRALVRRRGGQLAVFDIALMIPLLALSVLLVSSLDSQSSNGSTPGTEWEFLARSTLADWMMTTVLATNYTNAQGAVVHLTDTNVAVLLQEITLWVGCGSAEAGPLNQSGEVEYSLYLNLRALALNDFQGIAFSAGSADCGHPLHLTAGPAVPSLSQDLVTAWTTLPGLGGATSNITVGVYLWAP